MQWFVRTDNRFDSAATATVDNRSSPLSHQAVSGIDNPTFECLQVRLQLQSFGFTKGKAATQVPTYKGSPLHVLATIVRNEGITGPFKV